MVYHNNEHIFAKKVINFSLSIFEKKFQIWKYSIFCFGNSIKKPRFA